MPDVASPTKSKKRCGWPITRQNVPPLIVDHVRHMGALQKQVIALTVDFMESPRVAADERVSIEPLAEHAWRVTIRFGFVEIPDIPAVLRSLPALRSERPLTSDSLRAHSHSPLVTVLATSSLADHELLKTDP